MSPPTEQAVLIAFGLTLFAGLATGVGSALAFFAKRTNARFLSGALGFSAGVMIYISFTEILGKSRDLLSEIYGTVPGNWFAVISFFAGMFVIAIIGRTQQGGLGMFDDVNGHGSHQIGKAAFAPECLQEAGLLQLGQDAWRNAAADINATGGQYFESQVTGFIAQNVYEQV